MANSPAGMSTVPPGSGGSGHRSEHREQRAEIAEVGIAIAVDVAAVADVVYASRMPRSTRSTVPSPLRSSGQLRAQPDP
jgi:hypothetical protein